MSPTTMATCPRPAVAGADATFGCGYDQPTDGQADRPQHQGHLIMWRLLSLGLKLTDGSVMRIDSRATACRAAPIRSNATPGRSRLEFPPPPRECRPFRVPLHISPSERSAPRRSRRPG